MPLPATCRAFTRSNMPVRMARRPARASCWCSASAGRRPWPPPAPVAKGSAAATSAAGARGGSLLSSGGGSAADGSDRPPAGLAAPRRALLAYRPQRSRLTISRRGCWRSQRAVPTAERSDSTSTTSRCSRLSLPFCQAQSSMPTTRVAVSLRRSATWRLRFRRTVSSLCGSPRWVNRRSAGRPPAAWPTNLASSATRQVRLAKG